MIPVTKGVIVALLAAVVVCQLRVIPDIAAGLAASAPEFAGLEIPGVLMSGSLRSLRGTLSSIGPSPRAARTLRSQARSHSSRSWGCRS